MTIKLTISLIIGVLFYLFVIMVLIKKEKLNLKYTLLWLFTAVVMLIVALFPQIAVWISNLLGVQAPVNTIFVIEGLFVLLIILSLTSIVSSQMNRIRRLTQTQALLESRVRQLEAKINQQQ